MDLSSQNPSTTHNSDADKLVSADTETRLPFTNSLASTVHTDRSRTLSSAASENEQQRTVNKSADCVRSETVTQNGVEPSNLSYHSAARAGDPSNVPLLGTTNGGVSQPTAIHATSNNLSQREVENCVAQWTGDTTQLVGGRAAVDVETLAAAADDRWYYCDPQGQIQGQPLLAHSTAFQFSWS